MKQKPIVILLMDRYFATIHKAIADYAVQAGWLLDATMAVASERYETPKADAIIAVYTITKKTKAWLKRHQRIPTVHVWMSEQDVEEGFSGTVEEGIATGRIVAEHFRQLGFNHFAYYQRFEGSRSAQRWQGFQTHVSGQGIAAIPLVPGLKIADSTAWLSKALLKLPKPLALFVQDDLRATESLHACRAASLSIPDDVAIIGVGNDELMTHSCGMPLSSVDVQTGVLATAACDLLKRRLAHPSRKQEVIRILPAGVIPRVSSDSHSVESVFVSRVIHCIRSKLHTELEPEDVAKALHCSRRWLDHECMRVLKHTCFEEITHQRIHRAKQLLADTDFPIVSIGTQVGLPHMPRFFRNFKALAKQTPAEYRRQVRGK